MTFDAGRIRHDGALMHSSYSSNGSAIPSNWRLSATGDTGVSWAPESASSVSYGSNSNDVSFTDAPGASSLASRADHVHRGVTSLAHSSNTYTGPVVLETEGSLYIVRSAANTYRFGSTGSAGGGGGSGTLTTVEEVDGSPTDSAVTKLVFPNGTLSITSHVATYTPTSSGGTTLPLDVVPASPSSWDDEFTAGSLAGMWTIPLTSAAGCGTTATLANDWVEIKPSSTGSKHAFGFRQASPTGSFKIWGKIADQYYASDDPRPGLFVGVSGGKAHVCGPGSQDNWTAMAIGVTTYSETADWSGYDGFLPTAGVNSKVPTPAWYRIRWDAAGTTLYFDFSMNGVIWDNFSSRAGQSQPTSLGLVIYSNSGATGATHRLACDYLRVEQNATF